jgi:hypothetical protein
MAIDMTAQLVPVLWGMVVVLCVAAAGIVGNILHGILAARSGSWRIGCLLPSATGAHE